MRSQIQEAELNPEPATVRARVARLGPRVLEDFDRSVVPSPATNGRRGGMEGGKKSAY